MQYTFRLIHQRARYEPFILCYCTLRAEDKVKAENWIHVFFVQKHRSLEYIPDTDLTFLAQINGQKMYVSVKAPGQIQGQAQIEELFRQKLADISIELITETLV